MKIAGSAVVHADPARTWAAITADTGMTPASPAPLIPKGFSGEGVS